VENPEAATAGEIKLAPCVLHGVQIARASRAGAAATLAPTIDLLDKLLKQLREMADPVRG